MFNSELYVLRRSIERAFYFCAGMITAVVILYFAGVIR